MLFDFRYIHWISTSKEARNAKEISFVGKRTQYNGKKKKLYLFSLTRAALLLMFSLTPLALCNTPLEARPTCLSPKYKTLIPSSTPLKQNHQYRIFVFQMRVAFPPRGPFGNLKVTSQFQSNRFSFSALPVGTRIMSTAVEMLSDTPIKDLIRKRVGTESQNQVGAYCSFP